ncbi:helix-turn-helix domain-containing protein [Methylobacterium sp. A49B]
MITGSHLFKARISIGWTPAELAKRAKVPLSVVARAEGSPGEPVVTISQLDAMLEALRAAGAYFPPTDLPRGGT